MKRVKLSNSMEISVYELGFGKRSSRIVEIAKQLESAEWSGDEVCNAVAEFLSLVTKGEIDRDAAYQLVVNDNFTINDYRLISNALVDIVDEKNK